MVAHHPTARASLDDWSGIPPPERHPVGAIGLLEFADAYGIRHHLELTVLEGEPQGEPGVVSDSLDKGCSQALQVTVSDLVQ